MHGGLDLDYGARRGFTRLGLIRTCNNYFFFFFSFFFSFLFCSVHGMEFVGVFWKRERREGRDLLEYLNRNEVNLSSLLLF